MRIWLDYLRYFEPTYVSTPRLRTALLHESSLARAMPQDAAHDLPDEVPEARQKQPESGPTQLVNDQLTPNKRPISDGAARAHVRQRCCTNRSSCNNASPARSKTLVGRILPISQPIAEALARGVVA